MTAQTRKTTQKTTGITLEANAKVNLYLCVEPVVVGGYHRLRSVFSTITLRDTLHFSFVEKPESPTSQLPRLSVEIVTHSAPALFLPEIPCERNIITKALRAFEAACAQRESVAKGQTAQPAQLAQTAQSASPTRPFHVTQPACAAQPSQMAAKPPCLPAGTLKVIVTKRIPTQAGLGGGSADAAATIRALALLCGLSPERDADFLWEIARRVGADVPFFLSGGCALMGGFGDVFERSLPTPEPPLHLALVKPLAGISTAAAYQAFDAALADVATKPQRSRNPRVSAPADTLDRLIAVLTSGRTPGVASESGGNSEGVFAPFASATPSPADAIARALVNNLEPVVFTLMPQLASLAAKLAARPGVLAVRLCGSGSTLFALCTKQQVAQAVCEHFALCGFWTQAVQTCVSS